MLVLMVSFLVVGNIFAQEDKTFQTTEEEFIEALGLTPPAMPTPSSTVEALGPGGIVEDRYEDYEDFPVARALILFDFDSDAVKSESYPILKNLANALQRDLRDIALIVAGHTDSTGTDDYNMGLSERRAQAVIDFLVSAYDIEADRLKLRYYGERQPIASNATETGQEQNRRVEFIRIR